MIGHDFFNEDYSILFNWVRFDLGEAIPEHAHDYPHDCFLLKGKIRLVVGPIVKELEAPDTIRFPHGAVHSIVALTDGAEAIFTHPADKVPR